jgi:hypothetical protein
MDHGVQTPGAPLGPNTTTEDAVAASPEVQAAKKRKLILRDRQKSPALTSHKLETTHAASHNEIPISDDEEAETVGEALHRKRGWCSISFTLCMTLPVQNYTGL